MLIPTPSNNNGESLEIGVSGWRNNAFDHSLNSMNLNQYLFLLEIIHSCETSLTYQIIREAHGTLGGEKMFLSLLTIQITVLA